MNFHSNIGIYLFKQSKYNSNLYFRCISSFQNHHMGSESHAVDTLYLFMDTGICLNKTVN